MKKFTILCAVLFTCMTAFAVSGTKISKLNADSYPAKHSSTFKNAGSDLFKNTVKNQPSSASMNRVSQAPFFSEVFAGGIPPTWQNIDSSGSGVKWTWTTTGTFNAFFPLLSDSLSTTGTSASNGYLMYDSDSAGTTAQGNYGVLITDAIDCSLHPTVRLTFNEYFAKFDDVSATFPNTARVYISTDGTNWTLIHATDAGMINNDETPNPSPVGLNISSYAGGQATVYLKFSFTGDYSYWWFVDDLELAEVGAIDAGIIGIVDPYSGCVLSNTEDIIVGVVNEGVDTISNIPVSYSVNGGTIVSEVITDTIAPGDTIVYTFTTPADLSSPGNYDILSYVALSGDGNTLNDTTGISTISAAPNTVIYNMGFELLDDFSAYSVIDVDGDGIDVDIVDTYARTGTYALRFPATVGMDRDNWIFTNCFDFLASNTYNLSFWFQLFNSSPPAVPYTLEVYIGATPSIPAMTLLGTAVNPSDTLYANFNSDFTVPSDGNYYIAFRAFGSNITNNTRIDDITVDFAIGINSASLSESVIVYPNPSQGKIFVVNKGITGSAASINVMNTVGQVVATINSNNFANETIDLSTQPDGLYTVQVRTATGVTTKTVMVSSK